MRRSERARQVHRHLADQLEAIQGIRRIKTIWEIGSRDGKDATALLEAFPDARLHAFEPNPATFRDVAIAAVHSRGRMSANFRALSDQDGVIDFWQIDSRQTRSSWSDGNPGASSLFRASGAYDAVERYVQRRIKVEASTAATIIKSGTAPVPQFIWMDVQGAELLVLRGFGSLLEQVDAIYLELSLKSIYQDQALADDVVSHLTPHFLWHSVVHPGSWQFDALFISRRGSTLHNRLRDSILRTSLRTPGKLGIRTPGNPIRMARAASRKIAQRL